MKFPQWMDLRKDPMAPGQIFDHLSYWGIFRYFLVILALHLFLFWLVEGTNNERGYKLSLSVYFYSSYLLAVINLSILYFGAERLKSFFSRLHRLFKRN